MRPKCHMDVAAVPAGPQGEHPCRKLGTGRRQRPLNVTRRQRCQRKGATLHLGCSGHLEHAKLFQAFRA
eukprot:9072138-Alexandrium_andersonii.AAC.1